jgi:hypothetical protein
MLLWSHPVISLAENQSPRSCTAGTLMLFGICIWRIDNILWTFSCEGSFPFKCFWTLATSLFNNAQFPRPFMTYLSGCSAITTSSIRFKTEFANFSASRFALSASFLGFVQFLWAFSVTCLDKIPQEKWRFAWTEHADFLGMSKF